MTGPNDEWPIHPDNEWPVRPDPEAKKALYVPPDEIETPPAPEKPSKKPQFIKSVLFTAAVTAILIILLATDYFDGYEADAFGFYAAIVIIGILSIIDDEPGESKDYRKKLSAAKPRRALITDDMQSVIIDLSNHKDSQVPDGEWPVLQRNEPKPTFDRYQPDKSEEPYWPHLPLPEEPTYYQRIRRISWVTGCFMLITTVFGTIVGFIYPDETAYPEVQIFFAVVSGICFVIAYSEQLFLGDDH